MGRKTKKQIESEELESKVEAERKHLLFLLHETDVYSQLLDPLIDTYIDTYRVYEIMYKRWSDAGFPETKRYTNKAGATNDTRHPLSQQVDIWTEKKLKALERLGMTNKALAQKVITGGTTVNTSTGVAEKEPGKVVDELAEHRKKWASLKRDANGN